jgi:hypothetical protein
MVPNQIQLSLKMKLFESDRLQPEYADVPGQWGTYGLQMEAQIIPSTI